MMAGVPGDVGALDEAWLQAGHLAVVVVRGVRAAPCTVVPLADETAPVFDVQLGGLAADLEGSFLIAVRGGRKQVDTVAVTGRQVNALALRDYRVGRAGLPRRKMEDNIVEGELPGQHLGRQSVAGAGEATLGLIAVIASCGEVVFEFDRSGFHGRHRSGCHAELQGEGSRLIGTEGGDQIAIVDVRRARGLLLTVYLAGGRDGCREGDVDIRLRFAVELHQANDELVALFGFLHAEDADAGIAHLHHGEGFAQCSGMFGCLEGDQRSVESLRLPIGLAITPIVGVTGKAVGELVVADVLRGFIGVASGDAGRAQKGEAQGVIVGLIGAVFGIGEYGRTELAAHVGEVDPLM